MNSTTKVILKTIADIETEHLDFYIDAYQRGYRWTEAEVKDLLDDISEFSQSNYQSFTPDIPDRFYCLQPIIVTQTADKTAWKVIDGQQRLTTLYLIYLYYVAISSTRRKRPDPPFQLHYNGKPVLEECLSEILDEGYIEADEIDEVLDKFDSDIDCYFVLMAFKYICRYFNALDDDAQLRHRISDMKKVFDNFMKLIWYELIDCDEQDEIEMFTKINVGKIPLTNAELIKALLLRAEENKISTYQEYIALKWDEMEARLSDSGFWGFLVNTQEAYSTRIDFIFEIMARHVNENTLSGLLTESGESYYVEQAYNKQYFSFHVFNNYVRYMKTQSMNVKYYEVIWKRIEEYYQMFHDWYSKTTWYHLIGYIVATADQNKDFITILSKLSDLYTSHEKSQCGHKTMFENQLREMIRQSVLGTSTYKKDFDDLVRKLEYKGDGKLIRKILLLYNISTLEKSGSARFPFDKYKDVKVGWDLEHINAIADERPYDTYARDDNECLVWLINTESMPGISDLMMPDGETKVSDLITEIKDKKLYLPQNEAGNTSFNSVYDVIIKYFGDDDEPDNSIANLTLLDAKTNRGYKNDIFPLKRKKILENCTKEIFTPICTKYVFLKAFMDSNNLLKWSKDDKTAYVNDMIANISTYLKLED